MFEVRLGRAGFRACVAHLTSRMRQKRGEPRGSRTAEKIELAVGISPRLTQMPPFGLISLRANGGWLNAER